MSILKVDTINEKTSGNGVAIPGHVVQAVTGRFTTYVSITTDGYTNIGSLSITPKFANSKILITTTNHVYLNSGNASTWRGANFKLLRDSTTILLGDTYDMGLYSVNAATRFMLPNTVQYHDTPNTTSAVSYSIQMNRRDSTTVNVQVNREDFGRQGFMLLQEIAQ